MGKYRVTLAQICYGDVCVEAETEEEAKKVALEAYEDDLCNWDEDFVVEVSEIEKEDM